MGTVIWGVVWPLICFCLAGKQLIGAAYLLFACPILPGLLGIGLSRLKAGFGLSIARSAGVLVLAIVVICCSWHLYTNYLAGREIMELLEGKGHVTIDSFQIDDGQRRVICTDKAVGDYVAKRNHIPHREAVPRTQCVAVEACAIPMRTD